MSPSVGCGQPSYIPRAAVPVETAGGGRIGKVSVK
jgi:hypothetical protein